MSYEVFHSEAAYLMAMTPEQRAIYDRGYRDFGLDSTVANDAMIACANARRDHALDERLALLRLGFRDEHPLCKKLNDEARDWDDIAYVQRRLSAPGQDVAS